MSDWQPIETAPKDGTRFIAHASLAVPGWNPYFCNWSDEYKCWWPANPTHWMPIPEPPTEQSAEQIQDGINARHAAAWEGRPEDFSPTASDYFGALTDTPFPTSGAAVKGRSHRLPSPSQPSSEESYGELLNRAAAALQQKDAEIERLQHERAFQEQGWFNQTTVAEVAKAKIERLKEALAFARCTIKTGEPWTKQCEEIFSAALKGNGE